MRNIKADCGKLKICSAENNRFATNGNSKKSNFTEGKNIYVPLVNMTSFANNYIIEIYIPGIKKQDLKVDLEKNILTIKILKKNHFIDNKGSFILNEFNYNFDDREIDMPTDAETCLAQVEYHDGIIVMNIPKTTKEVILFTSPIAVF
jgi:HSP20 family protein